MRSGKTRDLDSLTKKLEGERERERGERDEEEEEEERRCPGEASSSGIIQTQREGEVDLIHRPSTQASARTLALSHSVLNSFFWTLSLSSHLSLLSSLPPSLF